jgi:predicted anti-sigma-YlaC factor YlaD
MTCSMMMSLGIYVLGAVDAAERRRVEGHLSGCPACRSELRRLAPLPGLLADVPEAMLATARPPDREARQPARAGGRWRRMATVTGVAACIAAVAGTAGGFWLASGDGGGQQRDTLTLTGTNPATHVSATADLTATSWGTSIQLQVRGLPVNVQCRLVVRSRAGQAETTGAWDAWQDGPVSVPASASWRPSDIASLQVMTAAGNLVTMTARQAGYRNGSDGGNGGK